jgi:hypothetical protein
VEKLKKSDPLSEFIDFLTSPMDKLSNPGEGFKGVVELLPAPPPLPPLPIAFYKTLTQKFKSSSSGGEVK